MFRSEEEKVNIVIGEALLSLLEDADMSSEALRVQLNRMLKTETDDVRLQLIDHALRQTRRLLSGAASEDSNFLEKDIPSYGRETATNFLTTSADTRNRACRRGQ